MREQLLLHISVQCFFSLPCASLAICCPSYPLARRTGRYLHGCPSYCRPAWADFFFRNQNQVLSLWLAEYAWHIAHRPMPRWQGQLQVGREDSQVSDGKGRCPISTVITVLLPSPLLSTSTSGKLRFH